MDSVRPALSGAGSAGATLSFARYNKPDWHLGIEVAGPGEEVQAARRVLEAHLHGRWLESPPDELGLGESAVRDAADRMAHHDTRACLDLLGAEQEGACTRTRREWSVLVVERVLDLLHFDVPRRRAFYTHGYRWAIELGRWSADELQAAERRFASLEPGLRALVEGRHSHDADVWGGRTPAAIAERLLAELVAPASDLLRLCADAPATESVRVVWAVTHLHSNRLGIEAIPEAVLRYFLAHLHRAAPD